MKNRFVMLAVIVAIALAGASAVAQNTDATSAYATLTTELEALSQKIKQQRSMDAKLEILREIEDRLVEFRGQYPDTPEALDAAFQLGMIKHNIQEFPAAAQYLAEFIMKGQGEDRSKLAFAHYYLAEAYKATGAFDDAEAEFKTVVGQFGDVNPRLTQFAQQSLQGMELERKLAVGKEPIDFQVTGTNGETLSPDKFKGKVLLIDFWASWCAPCKADMPHVKKVYDKYKDKGFEIVGISLDRSRKDFDNYIKQNNLKWPQYFDGKYWQNDIAQAYGVSSIPATFLIDRDGKIRYKSLRGPQLENAVAKLINESS